MKLYNIDHKTRVKIMPFILEETERFLQESEKDEYMDEYTEEDVEKDAISALYAYDVYITAKNIFQDGIIDKIGVQNAEIWQECPDTGKYLGSYDKIICDFSLGGKHPQEKSIRIENIKKILNRNVLLFLGKDPDELYAKAKALKKSLEILSNITDGLSTALTHYRTEWAPENIDSIFADYQQVFSVISSHIIKNKLTETTEKHDRKNRGVMKI